ncbi:hypothetical protein SY83_06885 [Paenibacillus swuensis]|uniref:Uncharacterized protein n=1 Tax=Paenibacillus swuensis TaxID=1178515 RepID=A0A172TGJ1_9BACL|nr:hypothetical protein [Paenibacillus swuensis]ANE46056.1 hypothetical protein SY83_06885 [Paenibacillus swuensis]
MNRAQSHLQEVQLIAKLADLKDSHYQNMIVLQALTELLIEKGILTQAEIYTKANSLDRLTFDPPYPTA